MKRLLAILALLIMTVSAYAQLNVVSTGSKPLCKDDWCTLKFEEGNYIITSVDKIQRTSKVIEFHIGDNVDGAKATINDLIAWMSSAQPKTSISFVDSVSNEELTLYCHKKKLFMLTNGSAEYAEEAYTINALAIMVGTPTHQTQPDAPIIGYLNVKFLQKALTVLE